jgi:hypothetical protein
MSWKHDRCSARACTPAYPIYKHTHTPLILDKYANKLDAHPAHIAQIFWIRARSVGNGCNGMERSPKEWTRHGDKEGINKANTDKEREREGHSAACSMWHAEQGPGKLLLFFVHKPATMAMVMAMPWTDTRRCCTRVRRPIEKEPRRTMLKTPLCNANSINASA